MVSRGRIQSSLKFTHTGEETPTAPLRRRSSSASLCHGFEKGYNTMVERSAIQWGVEPLTLGSPVPTQPPDLLFDYV